MRIEKMSQNALLVAKYLEKHPKIEQIHYPGLATYPAHDLAKKYMLLADEDKNMYGFILAAEIKENVPGTSENARTFYDSLKLAWRATDLGRIKTVATLNAISTHLQQGKEGRALASVKSNTCRISCGVEHADDIIADLEQALAAI